MAKFLSTPPSQNSAMMSKSVVNIYDTIPQHILQDNKNFIQLLQDYYEFLNEKGMPINVITNMVKNNDIDRVDEEFISGIMSETMGDLPLEIQTNKKVFYNRVADFYRTKGTIESFRIFFRVFFNDTIDIIYPKDYTFTLGDGIWDATAKIPKFENGVLVGYRYGKWLNDRSMLSSSQRLTDGKYYQPFSYVIKCGTNISKWQYVFNKVCHPSGFVFYGEISIFIEILDNDINHFRIPINQPGFTRPVEQIKRLYIELLNEDPYLNTVSLWVNKRIDVIVDSTTETHRENNHWLDKYFSHDDIRQYYGFTVDEIDYLSNEPGIFYTQRIKHSSVGDYLLNENGLSLLTEVGDKIILEKPTS